jgi:hypothetical protein
MGNSHKNLLVWNHLLNKNKIWWNSHWMVLFQKCVWPFDQSFFFFSSPGPKVQVNYCHHLPSVVCKLFTFQASSPKSLGRLEPNLAGMFLGWSSTNLLFFVPVGYLIWLPGPIICSNWLKFQRSSSLKLMNWLKPNCKLMIIGMSFTKFLFFMPIGNPRWPPSQDID